jgi:hypothetical protein
MIGQIRAKTAAALAQENEDWSEAGFGNNDSTDKKETCVLDCIHGSPWHMA